VIFSERSYAPRTTPCPPERVEIPREPWITQIIEKALCVVSLGVDCYVLTNVYGDQAIVPYGALEADWERIAYGLLNQAMQRPL